MKIAVTNQEKASIQKGMIGLFFEDINYAADGGLYAEMLENRSFEFYKSTGDALDYQVEYDGGYGWKSYPENFSGKIRTVMGSPLTEENPHYMRVEANKAGEGISNKAYDGIYLQKGMEYYIVFWARTVKYDKAIRLSVEKDGICYAQGTVDTKDSKEETYNFWRRYECTIQAKETVEKALFTLVLESEGIVEIDFVSMIPSDAVAGIFRKDLFDMLKELHPGFLRFPGGCIVEGNTLHNRYRYKDTLHPVWARRNNWNRWAVHGNNKENQFEGIYSHYNQTLGIGYYEYFLLCELIGASPLPVLNVGFACQYQSLEMVDKDSQAFQEFVQDALDLIEFAKGDENTKWGRVRIAMGHKEPFALKMLGIGNEQWQTEKADFFERYEIFEKAIHQFDPSIQLIGSAGPDITSERYDKAWAFYHAHENQENFVYGVDEHYYVAPQWLYDHVDFYDNYDRKVKVFSGEYAAHPCSGFNRPDANTLEGALAEAAFLTGVERNADVIVLASYAPLFARVGYAQWSPDMIWFDHKTCYGTPSYYVQKMYAHNMGTVTLDTLGQEKEAAKQGIYYTTSYEKETKDIILKVVNAKAAPAELTVELPECWKGKNHVSVTMLTGDDRNAWNSLEHPGAVKAEQREESFTGQLTLPAYSFTVFRIQ